MKKLFVLAIVTSLACICFAQASPMTSSDQSVKKEHKKNGQAVPRAPVKQQQKDPPTIKFSMDMIESGRIDPGYRGTSLSQLVDAIGTMTGVKKGEFESTADYNTRKVAALTGKLLGNSSVEDTFAFVLPVAAGTRYPDGLKYSFNADTREVRLYVLPKSSSMNGIGAPDYQNNRRKVEGLDQFDIDFKIDSNSTYQGSNAYGATITVEKTISTRLGIAANRIQFLRFNREMYYSNPVPAVQFIMENAKAAKELPSLKALVVMKLADPYIVYDFFHSEPTRDKPTDMSSQGKYLTGNVLGIVFYSGLTGEIFARLPSPFGNPAPNFGNSIEQGSYISDEKTTWLTRISRHNGCVGNIDVRLREIKGIREIYSATCENKTIEISCEFDGEVSEEPNNLLPYVKVLGKSYSTKPACWQ